MVMPPSSTNANEYPYQRNALGPSVVPNQIPVSSPHVRNQMDQWGQPQPPQQQQPQAVQPQAVQRQHVPSMNGMNMMDQNPMAQSQQPMPPTQQTLPPTPNIPSSIQNTQISMYKDDLRSDMKSQIHAPELSQQSQVPQQQMPQPVQQQMMRSEPQQSELSVQSPTTSMPDKLPSSTTHVDVHNSNSIGMSSSHPSTPTPSSTTDDLANSTNQDSLLADKQNEDSLLSQSSSQGFGDYNTVTSMTQMYQQQMVQKPKQMDDLMPSNVSSVFSQDSMTTLPHAHPHDVGDSQSILQQIGQTQSQTQNMMNQQQNTNQMMTGQHGRHEHAQHAQQNQSLSMLSSVQQSQTPSVMQQHSLPSMQQQTSNLHGSMQQTQQPSAQSQLYDQNAQQHMMGANGMAMNRGMHQGITPMSHQNMNMGMPTSMMPNMQQQPQHTIMPTENMGYQPPISHHQERAALQQQLQELYCMPPAPEHQEKIVNLQERLSILTQHEQTEQCNGGPQCVLQSPIFTSPMIDSPQVTSTTGRGRGRGAPKTKKPRKHKGEKGMSPIPMSHMNNMSPMGSLSHQLPVSEDCVTPGAGLNLPSSDMSEMTELGSDPFGDDFDDEKPKKRGKKGRKPKGDKSPKEAKTPKTPKERKKREPKEPRIKRKYVRKNKKEVDESITDDSFSKSFENGDDLENDNDELEREPTELIERDTDSKPLLSESENTMEKIEPETTTFSSPEPGPPLLEPEITQDPLENIETPEDNETELEEDTDVKEPPQSEDDAPLIDSQNNLEDGYVVEKEEIELEEQVSAVLNEPTTTENFEPKEEEEEDEDEKAEEVEGATQDEGETSLGEKSETAAEGEEEATTEKTDEEKKKDEYAFDDNSSPKEIEELPKRTPRRSKPSSSSRSRVSSSSKKRSGKSKRRKGAMELLSEGEGEDMPTTPPRSPPAEEDNSNKRRSARNTQRKKYIDDVMLRFSDDEAPVSSNSNKSKKSGSSSASAVAPAAGNKDSEETPVVETNANKPNFVYVNTTEEDSMVVHHILISRMGKRPKRPPAPPPAPALPKDDMKEVAEEGIEKPEDGENKENKDEVKIEGEDDIGKDGNEGSTDEKHDIENKTEEEKVAKTKIEKDDELLEEDSAEQEKAPKSVEGEDMLEDSSEKQVKDVATEVSESAKPESLDEDSNVKDGDQMEVDEKKAAAEVVPVDKLDQDAVPKEGKGDGDDSTEENKDSFEPKTENNEDKLIDSTESKGVDDDKREEEEVEMIDVEEYYVKYRNFSYLHCEWKTEEELYKGDKRISNKIKRFRQKQATQMNIFENPEDEPFNPDYVEVDRVLDAAVHTDPITKITVRHYLVKWRSLQYEDSTWELEEDVDPDKIKQFERFRKVPPRSEWKMKKRPLPEQWDKLDKSPIYKGGNSLREYQLEGLNWLTFSWYNARNCILADEMGLGKTIQSLTFLHAAYKYGIRGPYLVIAPLSTIPNWQREIESWTDMNVVVYHGSAASRNMLQEYEMYYRNDKGNIIKDMTKFNILITTFEIIVTDFADLKPFNWRICVIDEAHRLKNRNCKLLEGLRQLNLEHRVLLSGTPLQNNINELFSLLNFLEPAQFPSSEAFQQDFGALKSETEVEKLQTILKPMMLRRLKEDVEKSLAPKEETVVEVELTNIQKKYYRGILERNFSFLSKGTTHANIPNLMNTMMELRKCCIHPYLLNGAEEQIQYEFKNQHGEDSDSYYKALINSSGKMVLIDKLLAKLKANGHRVLIFSQMVRCLDILEDYLMYRKYPFERIDGRIRGNMRQAAIDRYSRPDSDRFVFLLCTKAGGLGINLTAADTVIIYDSDWNPQNDLQAQARCHRIGQRKMVKIYRLLCRNTYEREMFDKASLKLGLDKAVLQSMNTAQGKDSGNKQLSKKEIEDLLKKGAYGALLDEGDGDKFCEEDIDVILARRTQVITMESEKGSTFSKATFAASNNRSDINIDDPDFWNKWAKKADIDTTEKDDSEDLVLSEPRRRTQIKRYGHDEAAIDMSELESSSDSDLEGDNVGIGARNRRRKDKQRKRLRGEEYSLNRESNEIVYGSWARRECFMIERGLLTFGWGRWTEILAHSQLRKGWREQDVEDCARVIVSNVT